MYGSPMWLTVSGHFFLLSCWLACYTLIIHGGLGDNFFAEWVISACSYNGKRNSRCDNALIRCITTATNI